ncbi:MAG: ATP-dependent DNA helicase [Sulfuritalea sp.]|nr:ATP-dependent DNA helicase [Sulfuritalea sp.]MCF8199502.1 ATP-dependent DNA helicase [Sulfuritalea sp.]
MNEIERIFALEGPLAAAVDGFRPRPMQLEMAQRIAKAIAGNLALVAEAGTGTGKTFAYLAPALLSGGKVIVSTGTKTLQDQLFNRDLPTLRDALKVGASIALLKGRANYVCPYHLERAMSAGRLTSREEAAHLRKIARFAERTRTGDKAECIDVPEDSGAWALATSTRENCLGQECPNVKDCFVLAARQNALTADVVVVNHHLFFADVMLKDEGMGELLPACNTIIFDEAHQLPEVAGLFFGESVSTSQIIELARDTRNEGIVTAKDYPALQDAAQALDKAARDLRLAVKGENLRLPAARLEAEAEFVAALQGLADAVKELGRHLGTQAERGEGLANCLRRAQELAQGLARWSGGAAEEGEGDAVVKWVEVYSQAMSLNLTPLDIAPIFQRQMEGHPRAWIFASATLAVGSNFSHYCGELGLAEADTAVWGSPFDYEKNALLYSPLGMPDPNSALYQEAVAEAAWPAIRASGGRAFVLCTSLRAMRRIRELLQEKLASEGLDLPLLMQGEGSRSELLERFRFLGNAILVASQSFWEGVDVRGEALSLVVIDKLPFAPPDDPVLSARIDRLRAAGRNPFMEYQLPRAVISMKQGSGRLIRDEDDRGVLMICDPRLTGKPYGKAIWRSLPPMRRTRDVADVESFFSYGRSA